MSEEKTKNAWLKFDEKGRLDIFNFCEGDIIESRMAKDSD